MKTQKSLLVAVLFVLFFSNVAIGQVVNLYDSDAARFGAAAVSTDSHSGNGCWKFYPSSSLPIGSSIAFPPGFPSSFNLANLSGLNIWTKSSSGSLYITISILNSGMNRIETLRTDITPTSSWSELNLLSLSWRDPFKSNTGISWSLVSGSNPINWSNYGGAPSSITYLNFPVTAVTIFGKTGEVLVDDIYISTTAAGGYNLENSSSAPTNTPVSVQPTPTPVPPTPINTPIVIPPTPTLVPPSPTPVYIFIYPSPVPTATPAPAVYPPPTSTPTPIPIIIPEQPPTFQQLQDQYFLYVNELFRLTVQATDINNDSLEIRATGIPIGASWSNKWGKQPVSTDLVWTPSQLGDFYVTFQAEDENYMSAFKTVRFAVINRPPSPTPAPTATNTPTHIPAPTNTPTITPTPTNIPTATMTPTPAPERALTELRIQVPAIPWVETKISSATVLQTTPSVILTTKYNEVYLDVKITAKDGELVSASLIPGTSDYVQTVYNRNAVEINISTIGWYNNFEQSSPVIINVTEEIGGKLETRSLIMAIIRVTSLSNIPTPTPTLPPTQTPTITPTPTLTPTATQANTPTATPTIPPEISPEDIVFIKNAVSEDIPVKMMLKAVGENGEEIKIWENEGSGKLIISHPGNVKFFCLIQAKPIFDFWQIGFNSNYTKLEKTSSNFSAVKTEFFCNTGETSIKLFSFCIRERTQIENWQPYNTEVNLTIIALPLAIITPTATLTATPTLQPTATPTVTPTQTVIPTATKTLVLPTNTPKPTVTPTLKPTATPKLISTPTITPTPTVVAPIWFVGVFDNESSTFDLSWTGEDYDDAGKAELDIFWQAASNNTKIEDIKNIHVYVSTDSGDFKFLGQTFVGSANHLIWQKIAVTKTGIAKDFRDGPRFGVAYRFKVYFLTLSGKPVFYGPFENYGPVTIKVNATPTALPQPTNVVLPSQTPTRTSTPTVTPKPASTPTLKPTATPTLKPTATNTPKPTPTWTPTVTIKPTATRTATLKPTVALTATPTRTPVPLIPSPTPWRSPTPTITPTSLPWPPVVDFHGQANGAWNGFDFDEDFNLLQTVYVPGKTAPNPIIARIPGMAMFSGDWTNERLPAVFFEPVGIMPFAAPYLAVGVASPRNIPGQSSVILPGYGFRNKDKTMTWVFPVATPNTELIGDEWIAHFLTYDFLGGLQKLHPEIDPRQFYISEIYYLIFGGKENKRMEMMVDYRYFLSVDELNTSKWAGHRDVIVKFITPATKTSQRKKINKSLDTPEIEYFLPSEEVLNKLGGNIYNPGGYPYATE